jgi:hypothetical protein
LHEFSRKYPSRGRRSRQKNDNRVSECLFWNDIQGEEEEFEDSRINKVEIDAIKKVILSSHQVYTSTPPTFFLAFYSAQIKRIRHSQGNEFPEITVGTVDSVQGHFNDVYIDVEMHGRSRIYCS